MSTNQTPIILTDSDEAASIRTVTGWVSRDGLFFGSNEQSARYHGASHRKCQTCGGIIEKATFCRPCHEKNMEAKYLSLPREPWNGEGLLFSRAFDDYTSDPFDFLEEKISYQEEGEEPWTLERLQFQLCKPAIAWEIDPNDYYEGHLPEEGEVDSAVEAAFEELNAKLRELKSVLSWSPINVAWNGEMLNPEALRRAGEEVQP